MRHRLTLAFVAFHLSALCALAYAALAQDIVPLPTVVVNYSGMAQLVTAIGALIGAITGMLGVILSWSNRAKIEKNVAATEVVSSKVEAVQKATDGMKTELMEAVKAKAKVEADARVVSATAGGLQAGRDEGVAIAAATAAGMERGLELTRAPHTAPPLGEVKEEVKDGVVEGLKEAPLDVSVVEMRNAGDKGDKGG